MEDVDSACQEVEHVAKVCKTNATQRLAAAVFLLLVTSVAGVRVVARRMVFRGQGTTAAPLPSDVTPLVVTSADGAVVHAAELPAARGAPTLVHFHDNRQTIASTLEFGRAVRARGLSVVLVEYRGYGESSALSPSEATLYADAEAVLAELGRRGVDRDRIILSGRSLGTGVAAEMARRGRGAALVLVAPFTSIPDLVRESVSWAPADWLVPDAFDTASKAGEIHVPTLVVHGDRDDVVPFHMGFDLSETISGARLLRVAGAGHGDVAERSGDALLSAIQALAALLRPAGPG